MKYLGERNFNSFFIFLNDNNINMKPCSKYEIEKIKQIVKNNKLPDSYIKFMQNAGNGFRIFRGSSYSINEIFHLKEWATELLKEDNSSEILTDDDFVFFMHQGYQFYFLKLNEGIEPPVYFYEEGENFQKFVKKCDSFTDFLIEYYNEIEYLIKD